MLTIAVCDDNIQFARTLATRIRKLCATMVPEKIRCDVISAFSAADDVLQYLKTNPLALLFLDIDMPWRSGFSLAEELRASYPDLIIVFVSSHDNLVFRSFDYSPLSFLRKSHLESELAPAFSRAIDKYTYAQDSLDFPTTTGNVSIRIKDILYIESQKNYFQICCANESHKCRGTLSQAEQMLRGFDFCKIHAAYLVNLANIDRLNSDKTISMKNGDKLNISQRRHAEFKNSFTNYTRRRYER